MGTSERGGRKLANGHATPTGGSDGGDGEGDTQQGGNAVGYNRGGTISELLAQCTAETGLNPPRPQWERDPYGPHTGLPYVREWYARMRREGMGAWDAL